MLHEELLARGRRLPARYETLVRDERAWVAHLERALAERGIATVDALPALRRVLARGEPLYAPHADGHPYGVGYRAVAEAAATLLADAPRP